MRCRMRRPIKGLSMNLFATSRLEEQAQLPANVQMQIYRMVQEAVSNIWRHAGATHVKMTVQVSAEGEFVLQLQDNGKDLILPRSEIMKDAGLQTCARARV